MQSPLKYLWVNLNNPSYSNLSSEVKFPCTLIISMALNCAHSNMTTFLFFSWVQIWRYYSNEGLSSIENNEKSAFQKQRSTL